MKKMTNPRHGSKNFILKSVELPDGIDEQLTEEEQSLLKYALASMDILELRNIYKERLQTTRIELVWRLIYLGQTLTFLTLFNDKVFIDWDKVRKYGQAYMQGFLDCKTQIKEVVENGLRKKSGRKA